MYFIVFEGLDGAGKSTLIREVKNFLLMQSFEVITTREPGGTVLGDELRQIILRKDGESPLPRTELLLYEAIRAQHVDAIIRPALAAKKWVLCDRFTASSIAFQSGGRSISKDQVQWLNQFATSDLNPHLTVLLDITEEESRRRREQREKCEGEPSDRIESENSSFHEKVRQSFLEQAKSPNWLSLSARDSVATLLEKVLNELRGRKWLVS
jgi:dTMP kinase